MPGFSSLFWPRITTMAVIMTLTGDRFHLTTVRISERAYNLSKDGKMSRSALLEKAIMDAVNSAVHSDGGV
jgi:hypothetical protein